MLLPLTIAVTVIASTDLGAPRNATPWSFVSSDSRRFSEDDSGNETSNQMRPSAATETASTGETGIEDTTSGFRVRIGVSVLNDVRLESVGYESTNPTSGIGLDSPSMETDPGVDLAIGYGIPLGNGVEVEIASGLTWNRITNFQAELSGPLAVPMTFEGPPINAFPAFDPRYQYPVVNPGPPQTYPPKYPTIGGGSRTPWWPGAVEGPNGGSGRIMATGGSGNIYQVPLTVNASWGLKYRDLAFRASAGLGVQLTYIEVDGIRGGVVEVPFIPGATFGDPPISAPVQYDASFSSWSASFRYEVGLSLDYSITAKTRIGGYLRYAGTSPLEGSRLEMSPGAPGQYILPDLKAKQLGTISVGLKVSVAF